VPEYVHGEVAHMPIDGDLAVLADRRSKDDPAALANVEVVALD